MSKFGPTRGELKIRLGLSLVGLALMAVAVMYHGIPKGPAFIEVIGLAGVFFGGTALWSGYRLLRKKDDM